MKLVLLGGSGQLGTEILAANQRGNFEIIAPPSKECDITDYKSLAGFLDQNTDTKLIINAAAYTDVVGAENDPTKAQKVNKEALKHIARQCRLKKIPLIHISTDYVFSGERNGGYNELDQINPVNQYGKSKAAGEEIIQKQIDHHIILRTSWLFGQYGKNFLKTILHLAREKQTLDVVNDQTGSPTPAKNLAQVILKITNKIFDTPETIEWGIYHYAGKPETTWYDFACSIVETAKRRGVCPPSVSLRSISTIQSSPVVMRPQNTSLLTEKIIKKFDVESPDWQTVIDETIESLFPSV